MKKSSAFSVSENATEKIVSIDYAKGKKILACIFIIFLTLMSSVVLFAPTIKVNHKIVTLNISEKVELIATMWIPFIALYLLLYFPLRITFTKKSDGLLLIDKVDWFFYKKSYTLTRNQGPRLIARQRRMVGTTVLIGTQYQPIIRYTENGVERDISLVFIAAYFMRGFGPRGVFTKDQMEEIASQINLPLIFE